MKTLLFLHGFFASGSDPLVSVMRESLKEECRVISPDLSIHPGKSLELIKTIVGSENPDLLVGNSCGAFYAQIISPIVEIPALLGNPVFAMSSFLETRRGERRFKFPREDGMEEFMVDDNLIEEFREVEKNQFDNCSQYWSGRVWGLFGENDEFSYEKVFAEHYKHVLHFPGRHVPTDDEVKNWYVPAIKSMLI